MTFRKAIFWAHLAAGLAVGGVILVVAGAGLLMAYQRQLLEATEPRTYATSPAGERLTPGALFAKAREAFPATPPSGLTLRRDPAAPAAVALGRDRVAYLNPSTGAVLGEGSWMRPSLHQVEQIHRNLAMGETGRRVTGASCLAFAFLVVSGLVLWIPRSWGKAILSPRLRLRGKVRDFNWHNAVGVWAALPLLMAVLTGLVINYEWANRLLFRAAGSEPPPRKAPARAGGAPSDAASPVIDASRLNALWRRVEAKVPDWRTISLRTRGPGGTSTITADWGDRARPDQRAAFTADLRTGEILKEETFESASRGRQWRMWVRLLHTGEAGGLVGQTIAALAALGAIVLVWTGFALAWRRFRRRPAASDVGLGVKEREPLEGEKLPVQAGA